ncbi:ankyrin repeat domain-containing protein [Jannaschia sp. M317]|uniref:ankyrin repeat domain-containing protein n=1 Tax=Jannaschia sp. M317 TaxID=2867011 RepID=UPI0021A95019|nr:ankyrin repeat domain-containing protein [Jannaschia sp. M317]UWQ19177.1 ankyrin repeat domain-containing protein [Jannaschia sp. M317]
MPLTLETLRRSAKRLRAAYEAGDSATIARVTAVDPRPGQPLRHADFLHIVAREAGFSSWPAAKFAEESIGMDRAQKRHRLRQAVYFGQHWIVERLLAEDLAPSEDFALAIVLYDREAVMRRLADDPGAAVRMLGPRRPILHLAFSRHFQAAPEKRADMLAIAAALRAQGADVNDAWDKAPGQRLSALYATIGHARNLPLAEWLLTQGADPNDGESLYHACEMGHAEGVRLLLANGADPAGTNAVLRALDFNAHDMVAALLAAGASLAEPGRSPALHHAARRGCDGRMAEMLMQAGAEPAQLHEGVSAHAYARVYGARAVADAIEVRATVPALTEAEALMAGAAEGAVPSGRFLDPGKLPPGLRNIIRDIAHLPDSAGHITRLAGVGVEYDRPDGMGVTAVQVAGWAGQAAPLAALLALKPDLGRVNAHGGTLLGAILHGAQEGETGDHLACAELALRAGVALPRWALEGAGDAELTAFLRAWAVAHPGQVVD